MLLTHPSQADFEKLLAFRVTLRRFQHWSETQARAAGLTHVQHQLLVAVKGHPGVIPPTIGDVARYLLLRHHSAVELVDRAEAAGLVRRMPDTRDARVVRVSLTDKGNRLVTTLTESALAELHKLAAVLNELGSSAMTEAESALAADTPAEPDRPAEVPDEYSDSIEPAVARPAS